MPRKKYTPPTETEWLAQLKELKRLQARVVELLDANNRFEYGYNEQKKRADKNAEAYRQQAEEHQQKLMQIKAAIGDDVPDMRRMQEQYWPLHPMMMRRW